MKWSNILAIILLIPVLFCSARADVLTGKVVDAETRGVLRDVNLRVIETNQVVTTNKKGEFVVRDLPAGTYHLVASHVTYQQSHVIEVTVPSDEKPKLD